MKPVNIILDLLRTYMERGTSVANIMATGAMFGCSENQMRVNLSRLAAKGSIVNFARGAYRLAEALDPVNDFIESWRLGEDRTKPWTHTWLLAASSANATLTTRAVTTGHCTATVFDPRLLSAGFGQTTWP